MIILRKQKEYSTVLAKGLAGFYKNILRKSPMQAKRAAITEEKKILTPLAKPALRLNKAVEQSKYLALNPGQAISKGVEETIKNPITASTNIAGKITMVTDPLGTGAIPIGLIGTSSEIALKKKFPKYAKITKNLGDKYHKSKGSKYVEGISNEIINGIKGVI